MPDHLRLAKLPPTCIASDRFHERNCQREEPAASAEPLTDLPRQAIGTAPTDPRGGGRANFLLATCWTLVVLMTQIGCHWENVAAPSSKVVTVSDLQETDPIAALRQMEQAYRNATSYSDHGRVVLRYRERGDIRVDEAPLSVAVRLPSELRVAAYYSTVVSDGRQLRAKISDDSSGDIDGQILTRELNGPLTLEQIYYDPTLREAMTNGMAGQPLQLDLLFANDPLKSVFAENATGRTLEPAECDGHACYRVAMVGEDGEFTFWIDGTTFVLRRLDYPAASLLPELSQSDLIQDLSLRVEFRDATFEPALADEIFRFEVADDAHQVDAFVRPPHPLPTALFGKRPAEFMCYGLDGAKVGQQALLGKTAVLMWFNGHPACRATIEQLSEVYAARRDDETLACYAVSTEPSRVSNSQVVATLVDWNAELPLLRDLDACGRDLLGIPWTPTMIVLDEEGRVQIFEVGANTNLAQELPIILDRLHNGDDLASEIIADHEQQTANYRDVLAAMKSGAASPNTESTPSRGESTSDSSATELKAP